jgi:uncharacterized protein YjbJ (UPF0337 family)
MTWDQIESNWTKLKGAVRGTWQLVTDDDFDRIAGQREMLIATIQNRYGVTKDQAERELDLFERALEASPYKH